VRIEQVQRAECVAALLVGQFFQRRMDGLIRPPDGLVVSVPHVVRREAAVET
jgi:hypothetical protein